MTLERMLCPGLCVLLLLVSHQTFANDDVRPEPSLVLRIASKVLDENVSDKERVKLIRSRPEFAADLLQSLVEDIKPGTKQESARIPWLWEITILAAEHNNGDIIARILEVAIPKTTIDVADWQIAVIGGALIFEMSKRNQSPKATIGALVKKDPLLEKRWRSLIKLSKKLVVDQSQSVGIRYDALRIFAMSEWKEAQPVYQKLFATREIKSKDERTIRMAALSAIGDFSEHESTVFLLGRFSMLNVMEREKACQVFAKTEASSKALLQAIENGIISIDQIPERSAKAFRTNASVLIRNMAKRILS